MTDPLHPLSLLRRPWRLGLDVVRRGTCRHGVAARRTAWVLVLALAAASCVGGQGSTVPSGSGRPVSPAPPAATSIPLPTCAKPTTTAATAGDRSRPMPVPTSGPTRRVASRIDSLIADPATDRVLVMDGVRGSIAVVDGASLRVVDRIPVGRSKGIAGLAPDPTTGLVYVVRNSEIVSVLDPARARVLREARFGPVGNVVDITSTAVAGGKLWIAAGENGLLVVDLQTLQLVGRIGRWPGGSPQDIVVDPSGALVYVTSGQVLAAITTDTIEPVRCLKITGYPGLDPERNLLYLATPKSDAGAVLRVMDLDSMDVVATIRNGLVPVDVELDPRRDVVYVVDQGAYNIETVDPDAGLLWVVDARTNRLVRTLAIGISPSAAVLTDGAVLVATHTGTLSRFAVRG